MAGAFDMDDLDDIEEDASLGESPEISCASSVLHFQHAAKKNMYWFRQEEELWLVDVNGTWEGWSQSATRAVLSTDWTPWTRVLDESDAPFYRWYTDALTNAAFSEVDAHVLSGRGDEIAFIEEADPSVAVDVSAQITRHQLFVRSAAAAHVLKSTYGVSTGDRILFFLPAGQEQIIWVEACKRLGAIYCCCNPGLPPEQIADRIFVLQAKAVITAEHPTWSYVVYKALYDFVPVEEALELASRLSFNIHDLPARWSNRHTVSLTDWPFVDSQPFDECKNGDPVPRRGKDVLCGAQILILDSVCVPTNAIQKKVVKPEVKDNVRIITELPATDAVVSSMRGSEAVADIWRQFGAPVPVEANFPLFVIFTSGTTGKPKGVCHCHAYLTGLVETMKAVFNADPAADRMLTVGALGWITGQSYQIAAPLASGITAVMMRGNPVRPKRSRFAEVINKHSVTIFKAGSAFLREVMTSEESMQEVRDQHTSETLRIATFCAEPVSAAVQEFAMSAICPNYINSYWATEHGGIAWSRLYNNDNQLLQADAHSWPLPWVSADVYTFDETSRPVDTSGSWQAAEAKVGERADVVLTAPYPYMFRFVWGDVANILEPNWTGDRHTMTQKYWRKTKLDKGGERWIYVQGDFAIKYDDGSYTFHGRSDEVLNVNGILYGTEHIEGAVLRDKQTVHNSLVGHCVVVGYPDNISGEVPLAFIVPSRDASVETTSQREIFLRLYGLVNAVVGPVPVKFVVVSEIPQTFSGKFMRRLLKSIACDTPLGDTSTIANPDCIDTLKVELAEWRRQNDA